MRKKRADERDIKEIPERLDLLRWASCKDDLRLFLETYLKEQFTKDWSEAHLRCIERMQYAILNGGYFALAMPRGEGKTTIAKGAALWAILYGHRSYIVLIAATERKAVQLLKSLKQTMRFNDTLEDDFPEVIVPIRELEGKSARANAQTFHGESTGIVWKTDEIVLPRIQGSLCCESRIEVAGITGEIRGKSATLQDGSEVRPDLAIPDDPQTHASAKSPTQCDDREEIIRTDVLGLPGPGEKLACFIPCTVIKEGDLADRLLDKEKNPDFMGEKTAAILSWPTNLDNEEEKAETTWDDYNEARIEGLHNEDMGKAANEFYTDHREDLDKDARIGWDGRHAEGDVSALQSLMNLYFAIGKEAFYSEYQNAPLAADDSIYSINAETIAGRVNRFSRLEVPEDATMLVAMADINYIGLNVTVCAFKNDFTGYIVDYFKYPPGVKKELVKRNTPEAVAVKLIAQAVIEVEKLLDSKVYIQDGEKIGINKILIDANAWTEHVMKAIRSIGKDKVIADRGTAASKYRVPAKSAKIGKLSKLMRAPYHKCHQERGPQGWQIRHNSDFWRMVTQKAFLLKPGVPGSLSLWGKDPARHRDYAHEVAAEKLINYVPAEPNDLYQWHLVPGQANDQLDSTVGCLVAAASLGASLDGIKRTKKPKRNKPPQQTTNKGPVKKIRSRY